MNDSDRSYFAKHALGADPEFDWDNSYYDDYDDDDPAIEMYDDITPAFEHDHEDDDSFLEEE